MVLRGTAEESSVLLHCCSKTGYNLFIQEQYKLAGEKEKGTDSSVKSKEKMSAYGKLWGSLTEEQKKVYKERAVALDASTKVKGTEVTEDNTGKNSSDTVKEKKKKGVNGYNVFYSLNKDSVKSSLKEGEKLMEKIGALWGSLTDVDKNKYATLASNQNTTGVKPTLANL